MEKCLDSLVELLEAEQLIIEKSDEIGNIHVDGITDNSKEADAGDLFVCKGISFKSEYLDEAAGRGIVAYISAEKYETKLPCVIVNDIRRAMAIAGRWAYDFPGDKLEKVGVTGTKGKTSCVTILAGIMRSAGIGTAEFTTHSINIGSDVYESSLTTPEPLPLQRYFRAAVDEGLIAAAMEVSSQAMKMKRVYRERYKVGVFLNIEKDHISPAEHADMEEYLACKVSMFAQCDTVIINRDTDRFDQVIAAVPQGVKVILFGAKSYDSYAPDAVVNGISMDGDGLRFTLTYNGSTDIIESSLIGRFNVENITAAVLAALELGIDMSTIKRAVKDVFIPGRLNMLEVCGRHVIIDYAHNHLSYDRLYRTVRSIYPGANMSVLIGAVGGKAFGRRREAGQMANVYADRVVITEQDSADENLGNIASQIARYIKKPYRIVRRRENAICQILDDSKPGDVIVLTGKGAEKTLRVGKNSVRPYAGDYNVVRRWMSRNGQEKSANG